MHVTRLRRRDPGVCGLPGGRVGRRAWTLAAGMAALVVFGAGIAFANTDQFGTAHVGDTTDLGLVLPSDQTIHPIGDRLLVDNGKLLSSTISPDGRHLAALTTGGNAALTIVDLKSYQILQQTGASSDDDDGGGSGVGQEGPTYSPDGSTLWMPKLDGFARFSVNADGTVGAPVVIPIPVSGSQHALPAQAIFSPNGDTIYAAVNGQNRVIAMNPATGAIQRSWDVGVAPRDMVLVGNRLYVSNEGGRRAQSGDTTLNSYGTQVPADHFTGATTTGTVSVIHTDDPAAAVGTIAVGLHPTAMHAADGALFVTNTADDSVSVVDTARDEVVQTIATQPWPEAKVGYEPDGVTLTDDGHLLVTLGRANAIAVYRYTRPQEPVSYVGLLPTDYYPEEVDTLGDELLVTNLRGIGARGSGGRTINTGPDTTPATGPNTHKVTGSLQRFKLPSDRAINGYTAKVFAQNGWHGNAVKTSNGNPNIAPVPVPVKLGDPSTIKYVYLIIKENRSYDQVFGDMPAGNGDPSLVQFGKDVTPNQHALARQFGLYDNTYDVGTNSGEGHNWLLMSDNPEYTESTAGEYERSYNTKDDALGPQRSGFIWTGAKTAGKSARVFGEYNPFYTAPKGTTWQDYYCDARAMEQTGQDTTISTSSSSPLPSLNAITVHNYPRTGTGIPDQYRYEMWKRDFDAHGPANLNIMHLPVDHTGGKGNPHQIAQVADNDLALGKIVDTVSHSKHWKETAIFVVEDDTQNGVDHVDGHRGPVQVISPWAKHGVVDSRYYTQITMIRTIEQILGIHPMNQKDSAATPMRTAFTTAADLTPFDAERNRIPLTYGLAKPPACGEDTVAAKYSSRANALAPAPPASEADTVALWREWEKGQHLTGPAAQVDSANPEQMNRLTWYETHGWRVPYPGDDKVLAPSQVPGAFIPAPDSDG
ncbi:MULTISPECIES: bifunctional YncE family protein/alkaline phosphatase family protein [unclassified Streptomyces]|uniref:bifunctional YncE family protein/alkaline phosphatase family protein n=1 Tax=unclassified Streptomyces TaxID=2593676 RepID=UPI0035D94CA2